MQTTLSKTVQIIAVAASMVTGFLFYQRFHPEILLRQKEEVIGQEEIEDKPTGSYTGKKAGEDIPRLSGREEVEQLGSSDYVTVTTREIIATNVYSLKPWVNPYSLTRMRLSGGRTVFTGRRAREVIKGPGVRAEAYQEYYLVRLADSSYCLAQLNAAYEGKIRQGEEIALPIFLFDWEQQGYFFFWQQGFCCLSGRYLN